MTRISTTTEVNVSCARRCQHGISLTVYDAVYFVTNAFDKAIEDYERSTYLDEDFIFSHVQHAVAQYKMGQTRESMAAFRDILRKFRGKSEPLNY